MGAGVDGLSCGGKEFWVSDGRWFSWPRGGGRDSPRRSLSPIHTFQLSCCRGINQSNCNILLLLQTVHNNNLLLLLIIPLPRPLPQVLRPRYLRQKSFLGVPNLQRPINHLIRLLRLNNLLRPRHTNHLPFLFAALKSTLPFLLQRLT